MHVYIYSIYTYGHSPHDLPPTSSMFPSILVTPDGRHRGTQENQNCGKKWKYITIFWDSLQRSPRRKPQQPWKNKKQDSRKGKNYIQYFETPGWTPPSPRPLVNGFLWFFWFFFGFLSFLFCLHEAIPKTSRFCIFFLHEGLSHKVSEHYFFHVFSIVVWSSCTNLKKKTAM